MDAYREAVEQALLQFPLLMQQGDEPVTQPQEGGWEADPCPRSPCAAPCVTACCCRENGFGRAAAGRLPPGTRRLGTSIALCLCHGNDPYLFAYP